MNSKYINADNIDISDGRSMFITGQTGSGKSWLVHSIIDNLITKYSPTEIKFALFDLKRCEFLDFDSKYLLFDVVQDVDSGINKLKELATISKERLKNKVNQPKIFIYIEEYDIAFCHPKLFATYVKELIQNEDKTNIQIIYSSSRQDGIPDNLVHSFERILIGATSYKIPQLGVSEPNIVEQFNFTELATIN
jgi:ABC-type dipeptide/oligopeptide/nickel transport system ATPase component